MKTKSLFALTMVLLVFASCSKDSFTEEEPISPNAQINLPEDNSQVDGKMTCFITGAMVSGEPSTGAPHTVYAAAGGNIVNYDRRVTITLFDYVANELLAQRTVTILKFQNVSENAAVSRVCSDDISVEVTNVVNMSNFTVDTSCTWRGTGTYSIDCPAGDPDVDIDFCNGNDSDGDGICDDIDPTDDGIW